MNWIKPLLRQRNSSKDSSRVNNLDSNPVNSKANNPGSNQAKSRDNNKDSNPDNSKVSQLLGSFPKHLLNCLINSVNNLHAIVSSKCNRTNQVQSPETKKAKDLISSQPNNLKWRCQNQMGNPKKEFFRRTFLTLAGNGGSCVRDAPMMPQSRRSHGLHHSIVAK